MKTHAFILRLSEYIEKHDDISESRLSTDSGLDNSTIRKWRSGERKPSMSSAEKVLAQLGMTYDEFMSNPGDPSSAEILELWNELNKDERDFLKSTAERLILLRNS